MGHPGALPTSPPIVGREEELRAISDFLAQMTSGLCALVLEASAGIGKTTLWLAGIAEARELERTVLLTRAAESEARMSYGARRSTVRRARVCLRRPVAAAAPGTRPGIAAERERRWPFVVRLHEVTNGNPLFALEIARTAARGSIGRPR